MPAGLLSALVERLAELTPVPRRFQVVLYVEVVAEIAVLGEVVVDRVAMHVVDVRSDDEAVLVEGDEGEDVAAEKARQHYQAGGNRVEERDHDDKSVPDR